MAVEAGVALKWDISTFSSNSTFNLFNFSAFIAIRDNAGMGEKLNPVFTFTRTKGFACHALSDGLEWL